jgi:hypothetical protein
MGAVMAGHRRRWKWFAIAITVAIAVAIALRGIDRNGDPIDRVRSAAVPSVPRVRVPSWGDRADRASSTPSGYIPAWRVSPPRPLPDPPPAVPSRATVLRDSSRPVDGDRPSRPVPGL